MLKFICVAFAFLALSATSSEARRFRVADPAPGCNVTMPCDFSTASGRFFPQKPDQFSSRPAQFDRRTATRFDAATRFDDGRRERVVGTQIVSGRPSGCPRSYCGCGASLRVFGRIVPALNLASNWLRFPRTAPAPGMVAARRGHVFVLEAHVEGDTWMAYDANSGGHATRIHARSLRGFTVVNPRA